MNAPAANPAIAKAAGPSLDNFRLNARLVALVAPFMGVRDIRFYLNGINVRPHAAGGAVACATNGHVLAAVHDAEAICDEEVTLSFTRQMATAAGAGRNERYLVMVGARLALVDDFGEIMIQPTAPAIAESQFPDYARVIPSAARLRAGMSGPVNPAYLNKMNDVAIRLSKARRRVVVPQFFSVVDAERSPLVVRMAEVPEFIGLIMPMHADVAETVAPLPGWIDAAPADRTATVAKA